jgi:hypothetical protein
MQSEKDPLCQSLSCHCPGTTKKSDNNVCHKRISVELLSISLQVIGQGWNREEIFQKSTLASWNDEA